MGKVVQNLIYIGLSTGMIVTILYGFFPITLCFAIIGILYSTK